MNNNFAVLHASSSKEVETTREAQHNQLLSPVSTTRVDGPS